MNSTLSIGNSSSGVAGGELRIENIELSITESKTGEVYGKVASGNVSGDVTPLRCHVESTSSDYSSPVKSPEGRPPSAVVPTEVSNAPLLNEVAEKLKKVATELGVADETPPPCLSPEGVFVRPGNPALSGKFGNALEKESKGNLTEPPAAENLSGKFTNDSGFKAQDSEEGVKKTNIGCTCIVS